MEKETQLTKADEKLDSLLEKLHALERQMGELAAHISAGTQNLGEK